MTSSLRNKVVHGGRRYLPYVFTKHGITMLAGLLKNEIAVKVNIQIIKVFVEMRNILSNNNNILNRLTTVEYKMIEYDKKLDDLFDDMNKENEFKNKTFFDSQIYDAYSLLVDIISKAKKSIIIIDNYIDKTVLDILSKKKINVNISIISNNKLNLSKFNEQYPILKIVNSNKYHDRFIIIDENIVFHLGVSLKDLGKNALQ